MQMFREYEFRFNGFNFVSSVDVMSSMYQRIKTMPESLFVEMNLQALSELLADTPLSVSEIQKRLDTINAGGSYAFISLAGNNE